MLKEEKDYIYIEQFLHTRKYTETEKENLKHRELLQFLCG